MTETQTTQQESTVEVEGLAEELSSYERLRDSAPKDARVEWRDADRWVAHLRAKYQELAADESLSDSGKHERAQHHLETATKKIERGYEKAAKWLEKEAQRQELASIPLPDGRDLTSKVKDSSELLAIQNEAQTIVAQVERRREKMPKGIKNRDDHVLDMLRETYASAMEAGGVEGQVRARGVLRAAEQLGVDKSTVVAPYMEREHYEAADESRHLQVLRKQVPSPKSMIPANPFSPEGRPKAEYHVGRSGNIFAPRSKTVHNQTQRGEGRRRPWK